MVATMHESFRKCNPIWTNFLAKISKMIQTWISALRNKRREEGKHDELRFIVSQPSNWIGWSLVGFLMKAFRHMEVALNDGLKSNRKDLSH